MFAGITIFSALQQHEFRHHRSGRAAVRLCADRRYGAGVSKGAAAPFARFLWSLSLRVKESDERNSHQVVRIIKESEIPKKASHAK